MRLNDINYVVCGNIQFSLVERIVGTDIGDYKKDVVPAEIASDIPEVHSLHESLGLSCQYPCANVCDQALSLIVQFPKELTHISPPVLLE